MKAKATIAIEFEMERGQPENAANAALIRAIGEVRNIIERGVTHTRTGVKPGSVRVEIVSQKIED
jgi:hypothetical protein